MDYPQFMTKLSKEIILGFTIFPMKVSVFFLVILREMWNGLKLFYLYNFHHMYVFMLHSLM